MGPGGQRFSLCRPLDRSLLQLFNYTFEVQHDHRQNVNDWAWLQSNQTLYTKTGSLWALVEDEDQSSLAFDQDHRNMD